jgi:hypothetical protein
MEIGKWKQAKSWLLRPGSEEKGKKLEEANQRYLADRKAKTLKEYGLNEDQLNPIGRRVLEYSNINKPDNSRVVVVNGELTTEQQLKEQIEKNEQQKHQQKVEVARPIVKRALGPETLNLNIAPLPNLLFERSPEDIAAEERFREIERKINQEKLDRQTKGLMSFVPLKFYEPK